MHVSGEMRVAETTVTERTRRQAERLKRFRLRREREVGIKKTLIASRLGFGSTQTYDLYERGISIIRLDKVADWAAAFEVPDMVFVDAVMTNPDDPDTYTVDQFREHLRAAGLPDEDIDELAAIAAEQPAIGRKALAEGYVRLWRRHLGETRNDTRDHEDPQRRTG